LCDAAERTQAVVNLAVFETALLIKPPAMPVVYDWVNIQKGTKMLILPYFIRWSFIIYYAAEDALSH